MLGDAEKISGAFSALSAYPLRTLRGMPYRHFQQPGTEGDTLEQELRSELYMARVAGRRNPSKGRRTKEVVGKVEVWVIE
jgi:hypothetical protein